MKSCFCDQFNEFRLTKSKQPYNLETFLQTVLKDSLENNVNHNEETWHNHLFFHSKEEMVLSGCNDPRELTRSWLLRLSDNICYE